MPLPKRIALVFGAANREVSESRKKPSEDPFRSPDVPLRNFMVTIDALWDRVSVAKKGASEPDGGGLDFGARLLDAVGGFRGKSESARASGDGVCRDGGTEMEKVDCPGPEGSYASADRGAGLRAVR